MGKEQPKPFRSDRHRIYKPEISGAINMGKITKKDERDSPPSPTARERAGWTIHASRLVDYSRTFSEVNGRPLQETFKAIVEHRQKPWILDLMASHYVVDDAVALGFGGGVSVSLGFEDQSENPNISHLNGNLLNRSTWKEIDKTMEANHLSGFDVITSRPEGGLAMLTLSPAVHRALLERTWRILSPDGGRLYFQIPLRSFVEESRYFEWLKTQGIHVFWDQQIDKTRNRYGVAVYMIKTPDSPSQLPNPVTKITRKK